jgi:haloalkane dehalogenase
MTPSADPRYPRRFLDVFGQQMAYVEAGLPAGDPIVFLHGNPTSSYLWRNVMPHLEDAGRLIAPDLIGMGESAKLPDSGPDRYRFVEHRRYLDELLRQLGVARRVTLVIHDWGSALGFDWANRHRDATKGIAYMEAIVQPRTWTAWTEAKDVFQALRSPAGEEMILVGNAFVEKVLPSGVIRALSEEEMEHYRRPFAEPGEGRRPTLTWPRQIPVDGEPPDVTEIVSGYGMWLSSAAVPKLFINVEPGRILKGAERQYCRSWTNQTEVTIPGIHFVQEDAPDLVGQAIAVWYEKLG